MRFIHRLILAMALMLSSLPAFAQYTLDKSANEKIDEAVNQHYLVTEFDKAEGILLGTIQACGEKCKPSTIAKAWMYIGIVRGSGKNDLIGAKQAFLQATTVDPEVKLDAALSTPETKAAFEEVSGTAAEGGDIDSAMADAAGVEPEPDTEEAGEGITEIAAGMKCTPDVMNVQTRRPIPLSCEAGDGATRMTIRYQVYGSQEWKTFRMNRVEYAFQGEIPCTATELAGPLKYYVVAEDQAGDVVDTYGTKTEPITITIAPEVNENPPALPGKPPPARCAAQEICPPDFPGCGEKEDTAARGSKDWGASCDNSTECKAGLLCIDGSCETAPSCENDEDCPVGICMAGTCDIPVGGEEGPGDYAKNWFGLHFGADIAVTGGTDVCSAFNDNFDCFRQATAEAYPPVLDSTLYPPDKAGEIGDAYPGTGIATGLALGTLRIMASYDRALSAKVTLGLRGGFAFSGGPTSFLPVHGEARLAYWFSGMGSASFRPYAHVGGGVAQVDVKVPVRVRDCTNVTDRNTPSDPDANWNAFVACAEGTGEFAAGLPRANELPEVVVDAWRRMGTGFATLGGGFVFAFSSNFGTQLNVNAMVMLPNFGFVIQPSLGLVLGF